MKVLGDILLSSNADGLMNYVLVLVTVFNVQHKSAFSVIGIVACW